MKFKFLLDEMNTRAVFLLVATTATTNIIGVLDYEARMHSMRCVRNRLLTIPIYLFALTMTMRLTTRWRSPLSFFLTGTRKATWSLPFPSDDNRDAFLIKRRDVDP